MKPPSIGVLEECAKRRRAEEEYRRAEDAQRERWRQAARGWMEPREDALRTSWERGGGMPADSCAKVVEEVSRVLGVDIRERVTGRDRFYGYPASRGRGAAAVLLRVSGARFREIAAAMGISVGGVATALQHWERYAAEIGRVVESRAQASGGHTRDKGRSP